MGRRGPKPVKSEAIAKAALALFVELGVKGATTRAIARRAQTTEGSLYRYYASKEELARRVLADCLVDFGESIARALEGVTGPRPRLRTFVLADPDYARRSPLEHAFVVQSHNLNPAGSPTRSCGRGASSPRPPPRATPAASSTVRTRGCWRPSSPAAWGGSARCSRAAGASSTPRRWARRCAPRWSVWWARGGRRSRPRPSPEAPPPDAAGAGSAPGASRLGGRVGSLCAPVRSHRRLLGLPLGGRQPLPLGGVLVAQLLLGDPPGEPRPVHRVDVGVDDRSGRGARPRWRGTPATPRSSGRPWRGRAPTCRHHWSDWFSNHSATPVTRHHHRAPDQRPVLRLLDVAEAVEAGPASARSPSR